MCNEQVSVFICVHLWFHHARPFSPRCIGAQRLKELNTETAVNANSL